MHAHTDKGKRHAATLCISVSKDNETRPNTDSFRKNYSYSFSILNSFFHMKGRNGKALRNNSDRTVITSMTMQSHS